MTVFDWGLFARQTGLVLNPLLTRSQLHHLVAEELQAAIRKGQDHARNVRIKPWLAATQWASTRTDQKGFGPYVRTAREVRVAKAMLEAVENYDHSLEKACRQVSALDVTALPRLKTQKVELWEPPNSRRPAELPPGVDLQGRGPAQLRDLFLTGADFARAVADWPPTFQCRVADQDALLHPFGQSSAEFRMANLVFYVRSELLLDGVIRDAAGRLSAHIEDIGGVPANDADRQHVLDLRINHLRSSLHMRPEAAEAHARTLDLPLV